MKLRKILLIADPSCSSKNLKDFDFQARSLGYFMGRRIEKFNFNRPYAQLVFAVQDKILPSVEEYFPQSLLVRTSFESGQYKTLEKSNDPKLLNEYLISLIRRGLTTFHKIDSEVANCCSQLIEAFITAGYVEEWRHATVKISSSLRAILDCVINHQEFVATMKIMDATGKNVVTEKVAVRTKPDELLFYPKLGKLIVEKDRVFLFDKFNKPVESIGFVPPTR